MSTKNTIAAQLSDLDQEKFEVVKEFLGISHDSEVIRALIRKKYAELNRKYD